MKLDNDMLLVGSAVAVVAGAFMFKDKICPLIKIPFICDSDAGPAAGMPAPPGMNGEGGYQDTIPANEGYWW